ncbi:AAA family ATPase [Bacillus massiliigorillae]|uniref:AAA family ATPase n=1 Tax=Bacillus massiliigorillae TaxID=1243664 RepID=UPI0003A5E6AD|nr:AAA family ATPase [Bacillus massiliigorillae]
MIKSFSPKVIDQIKENYIVGVLATKDDQLPRLGDDDQPVTFSYQMNEVIFYVKPLSQQPKEMIQAQEQMNMSPIYIGLASKSISNLPLHFKMRNDFSTKIDEKINYIREKLQGKLLLFKPLLTQQKERLHLNIDDVIVEEEWSEGVSYHAVPKISLSPIELEQKLVAEEPIDFWQYNHTMPAPKYMMCGDYIYGAIDEHQWKIDASTNHYARILSSADKVRRITLSEEEKINFIASEREHVLFIDETFLSSQIEDRLLFEGMPLGLLREEPQFEQPLKQGKDIVLGEQLEEVQQYETNFLRELEFNARRRHLVYSREDLINFHTSVKSSAFTILSGQSGIGKTKLATLYGETLGLSQRSKTMLIMPISPSYTEPSDVLGYLNVATGLYTSVETGLVEFLLHAEKYDQQVHLLIMDEMNLSQIEHYFAPFLSLLELDEKERFLHLYNKEAVCHNNEMYKPSIQLKNNLVIVGTMNADETTKDLSDRLLDRSNVVVLEKRPFKEIKQVLENENKDESFRVSLGKAYGSIYMNWKSQRDNWVAFQDDELEFFDIVNEAISRVDPLKGFSIRNIIRMGAYLNNLPKSIDHQYELKREKAIDLFVKQRVITKIRGPIEIYEPLIGTVDIEGIEPDGELYAIFSCSTAEKISTFEKTKKELIRKARELNLNGYAT